MERECHRNKTVDERMNEMVATVDANLLSRYPPLSQELSAAKIEVVLTTTPILPGSIQWARKRPTTDAQASVLSQGPAVLPHRLERSEMYVRYS